MRKYIYLVVDHPDEELVGKIRFSEGRQVRPEKGQKAEVDKLNVDTEERYTETLVGLGYHDFDDQEDYKDRWGEVAEQKLAEVDKEHLEAAGLEPEEVLPAA